MCTLTYSNFWLIHRCRMVYAFSRDGAMPLSNVWHKVNRREVPLNAVWFSAFVAFCMALTVSRLSWGSHRQSTTFKWVFFPQICPNARNPLNLYWYKVAWFGYLSCLNTYIWVVFGRCGFKNGHQRDTSIRKTRLRAQNHSRFNIQHNWRTCMLI